MGKFYLMLEVSQRISMMQSQEPRELLLLFQECGQDPASPGIAGLHIHTSIQSFDSMFDVYIYIYFDFVWT